VRTEPRSWLFVPGDDERKLARAPEAQADALILDLEDAVVADRRPQARTRTRAFLDQEGAAATQRWVRVNPLTTPDALDDLAAVVGPGLDGIVLPKVRGGADVTTADHYLSALEARAGIPVGTVRLAVVATEVPEALFRLGELAGASARLAACSWGAEDLSTALGASSNKAADGGWDEPYALARSLCLVAARAAGVQPVDTLYAAFQDDDGLVDATRLAARQGFTGKLAIHPRQVPIINEHLTPTAEAVAEARAVVDAFAAAPDAGTVALDGRMLDRPHLVQAQRLLERAGADDRGAS
jgi:citrate lyase subunit beta / citryl-CoA lyase